MEEYFLMLINSCGRLWYRVCKNIVFRTRLKCCEKQKKNKDLSRSWFFYNSDKYLLKNEKVSFCWWVHQYSQYKLKTRSMFFASRTLFPLWPSLPLGCTMVLKFRTKIPELCVFSFLKIIINTPLWRSEERNVQSESSSVPSLVQRNF